MAGTSLDGVDAALVAVDGAGTRIEHALSRPYGPDVREGLRAIGADTRLAEVVAADEAVADAFAGAVHALLAASGCPTNHVTAIGSHGQTVWHRPGAPHAATVQIGDPSRIAAATGITTVADFRRADIAAGGEGAPLAPAFHLALLEDRGVDAAVLNLGGIANLTLPGNEGRPPLGFDCGPANTLLDRWAERHLGHPYDDRGTWGEGGTINQGLLEHLLADTYFRQPPPKSTGPEHFDPAWLERALDHHPGIRPQDVQATLVELTAASAAAALDEHRPRGGTLFVCGGGSHNDHLMERLRGRLPGWSLSSTAALGVDPDYVEAAAFAWLAMRRLALLPGNIPSVTGATRPAVLGGVYRA